MDYLTELEYKKSKGVFQRYLDLSHISLHMLIHGINNTKDCISDNFIPYNNYCDLFIRRLIHNMY